MRVKWTKYCSYKDRFDALCQAKNKAINPAPGCLIFYKTLTY